MKFDMLSPREQLVRTMNRIYYGGMTTLSGGNLSIKDGDNSIWITPTGVDKGKLTPADIVRIMQDETVEGLHKPSSELPFHLAIYKSRPDIRAIVHAHPPALVAFSITKALPDTNTIPQARGICGRVGYAPYALPGSTKLGANIAKSFAEGYDVVILENHGVAVSGKTLLEAFQRLETLDFCARTEMYAHRLGKFRTLTETQIDVFNHRDNDLPTYVPSVHTSIERDLRGQIVDTLKRAYQRQLMISTEGVISSRVHSDDFLITPTGQDRNTIDNDDLVMVVDGRREKGKLPSRSVLVHQEIYRRYPNIQSIIMAQSPYAMAYAISEQTMKTTTIPESYILLRDVPRVAYEKQFMGDTDVISTISEQTPVVLLDNNCVLVVGTSILQAFDRLEVLEFTAKSLIDAMHIGNLKPISERDTRELTDNFLHSS